MRFQLTESATKGLAKANGFALQPKVVRGVKCADEKKSPKTPSDPGFIRNTW